MNKNSKKKLDFLPNKLNKYSIRRFTVGTASILVGATLIFGVANDQAEAAENNTTQKQDDSSDASKVKVMFKLLNNLLQIQMNLIFLNKLM